MSSLNHSRVLLNLDVSFVTHLGGAGEILLQRLVFVSEGNTIFRLSLCGILYLLYNNIVDESVGGRP